VLSPHRRLGRSRTASTHEHPEPCAAQREAPESRQPPPGRDTATRSANPPQRAPTVAPPPRPALIHTARALKSARTRFVVPTTPVAHAQAQTHAEHPGGDHGASPTLWRTGAPARRPQAAPPPPRRSPSRFQASVPEVPSKSGVRPRAAQGGAAARSPRRPDEPTRGWRGGAGTPGPTLG
jgi:hypothetical protein